MKNSKQANDFQGYVVGFLFRNDDNEVALISKLRPEWQKGKLNGIGGKIEDGESPHTAMVREFEEETGAFVKDWKGFLVVEYEKAKVFFFTSRTTAELKSMEDERVDWYPATLVGVGQSIIPNLSWLIPLAKVTDEKFIGTVVK